MFRSVLAIITVSQVCATHYYHPKLLFETNTSVLVHKWELIEKDMQKAMSDLSKLIPLSSLDGSNPLNISGPCTAALFKFVRDFLGLKRWAHQMFDATGKPEGGSMIGTFASYGNYDQCLDIQVPNRKSGHALFAGQYCIADFRYPLPPRPKFSMHSGDEIQVLMDAFKPKTQVIDDLRKSAVAFYNGAIRLGLCIPSTCSKADLNAILTNVVESKQLNVDIFSCEVKEEFKLTTLQIVVISLFGVNCGLVLIGTLVHHFCNATDSTVTKCLAAFSIQLNVINLFSESKSDETSLKFMNGMRFFSMTWVVLGHTYLVADIMIKRGVRNFIGLTDKYAPQVILNGFVGVDTFFFITGLLMSYMLVKVVDLKGKVVFNPLLILIRRIARFWVLLLLIAFTYLVLPLASSGPLWRSFVDPNYELCRTKWWLGALFINNFFRADQMCSPMTWYLSADIQLLIVSFVYFYCLFKKAIYGHIVNLLFVTVSITSTIIVIYLYNDVPVMLISDVEEVARMDFAVRNYSLPQVHLNVYAIGLALGTYMVRSKGFKISKIGQLVGWIVAIACALTAIYGVQPWNAGKDPSIYWSMLYGGFNKFLWGLAMAWMSLMCWSGRGGWINVILSWNGFVTLNRLSFLIYLVHVQVLYFLNYPLQGLNDVSHEIFVWNFLGTLMVSLMVATFFRLTYEGPIITLEKMAFDKLLKSKIDRTESVETQNCQKVC